MRTLAVIRWIKTKHFAVRVHAVEDYDLDIGWDEDGSVQKGLRDGSLVHFGVIAEVRHRKTGAVLGEDSLWGCIEKTYKDFRTSMYLRDLVSNACRDARNALSDLQSLKLKA